MILVTGGTGFIGRNLVKYLHSKGYKIRVVDRNVKVTLPGGVEVIERDLLTEDIYSEMYYEYDAIFHCAGDASVARSVSHPIDNFYNHAFITAKMLDFARITKSKCFVFLSSVSIFDTSNTLPLNENSKIRPTSPYGAAKLAAEGYCYAYHRTFGLDIRIARLFNTFGPDCDHLFVYEMIQKIKNAEKEIFFGGSGNQLRDYIYIDDLVNALFIIWKNGVPGEDYNVCSGKPVKLYEMAVEIKKMLKRNDVTIKVEGKKQRGDIEQWYGETGKLQSIGFENKTGIYEGLSRVIDSL